MRQPLLAPAFLTAAVLLLMTCPTRSATAPPATGPAEAARLDRGSRLRTALLDTLDQAYAHGNVWPDRLVGGDPTWTYDRPTPLPDPDDWRVVSRATVVVHEPLSSQGDGVWVGYASGRLEFAAAAAAALAECQSLLPIARRAVIAGRADQATTRQADPPPASGALHLRVLDPAGRPVAGAAVGTFAMFGDQRPKRQGVRFYGPTGEVRVTTDAAGRAVVPAADLFAATKFAARPTAPVWVLAEAAGLVAHVDVGRSDLAGPELAVTAQPICHVTGHVTSLGLRQLGRSLSVTLADWYEPGLGRWYTTNGAWHGGRFDMPLAAGDWELEVYGGQTSGAARFIHVAPGQRSLDLSIDLPPDEAVTRFGQPAPELRQIKAWKNGGPTTLAALRGRVVLLEFWGYWCGPCVASMPQLMKLHDELHDRGLTIIAIHTDSAATMAEVDAKCADARRQYWGGRDLPFLVALDGRGKTRIPHSGAYADGSTTAAYGIMAFPSTLLIDRSGTLVGEGDPRDADLRARIVKLLAEPVPR